MGVVLARCTRCDRLLKVVTYQAHGKRLRNRRSPCCGKRMRKHTYPRADVERRPEILPPPRCPACGEFALLGHLACGHSQRLT